MFFLFVLVDLERDVQGWHIFVFFSGRFFDPDRGCPQKKWELLYLAPKNKNLFWSGFLLQIRVFLYFLLKFLMLSDYFITFSSSFTKSIYCFKTYPFKSSFFSSFSSIFDSIDIIWYLYPDLHNLSLNFIFLGCIEREWLRGWYRVHIWTYWWDLRFIW